MALKASAWSPKPTQPLQKLLVVFAFAVASLSFTYTLVSTPQRGNDLLFFYDIGGAWLNGEYNDTLRYNVYPPSTPVIFSPLAIFSFETAKVVWFVLNLLLTALSIYLTIKLIDRKWPWQAKYFLVCLVVSWAPFRVNLRNGQITMFIAALLLGSLLTWRRNRHVLAGVLLGFALCKYTLTFPFLLYFVWQKQWKVALGAMGTLAVLTSVFALRLQVNPISVVSDYITFVPTVFRSFSAAADLNSLLASLTGGHKAALILGLTITFAGLGFAGAVLIRRRPPINVQIALVTLFTLWAIYHRTYDFMFCLIPAAVLIDFVVQRRLVVFSYFWLAAFSILSFGLSGFAASRPAEINGPAASPWLSLLFHSERLLVLAAFWSLLWVLWKSQELTIHELTRKRA